MRKWIVLVSLIAVVGFVFGCDQIENFISPKVEIKPQAPQVQPVLEEESDIIEILAITSMPYKEVLAWVDEINPDRELAARILEIEKQGRKRKRVIKYLENRLYESE